MIKYKYEDKEYLLEFDRASVEFLEKSGFNFEEYTKKIATMQPLVFRAAFLKHHKFDKGLNYDKMWEAVGNKKGLINALIEMVAETYQTIIGSDEGNENWEVM